MWFLVITNEANYTSSKSHAENRRHLARDFGNR
jgi:hypothetical protein